MFAAWLNHHDTKAIHSIDSLVEENETRYLKHYLLDFGDILGSNGVEPKEAWSGHEYTLNGKATLVQMVTFGLYVPRWARADYPKLTGVGRLDWRSLDALSWKPNYPNPAFLIMDREDAFWAAKQVAAFSDAEIRALVETGEYSDPRATAWITECLIKRRDKIAEAWFFESAAARSVQNLGWQARVRGSGCGARDRQDPRIHRALGELGPKGPGDRIARRWRTASRLSRRHKYPGGNHRMRGR